MRNEKKVLRFLVRCLVFGTIIGLVSGCALVKATRHYEESTPIDWGLANTSARSVSVMAFTAEDPKWGVYAARMMKDYLLEEKAYSRVVLTEDKQPKTAYVITGALEYLAYGGTDIPTAVVLTVRVIETKDGQTRFMRTARASSQRSAYHVTMMRRIFVPAPYPEELLAGMLKRIAHDIALRSASPAVQNP